MIFPLPVIGGAGAALAGVGSDAAQTLTVIPEAITQAFQNVSEAVTSLRGKDWFGMGLITLGLLMVMFALGAIAIEETVQKPAREFVESGAAEKVVKLAKGG